MVKPPIPEPRDDGHAGESLWWILLAGMLLAFFIARRRGSAAFADDLVADPEISVLGRISPGDRILHRRLPLRAPGRHPLAERCHRISMPARHRPGLHPSRRHGHPMHDASPIAMLPADSSPRIHSDSAEVGLSGGQRGSGQSRGINAHEGGSSAHAPRGSAGRRHRGRRPSHGTARARIDPAPCIPARAIAHSGSSPSTGHARRFRAPDRIRDSVANSPSPARRPARSRRPGEPSSPNRSRRCRRPSAYP